VLLFAASCRLLSLGTDGKLKTVLQVLAGFAVSYLQAGNSCDRSQGRNPQPTDASALQRHVANPVRALLREMVLRYPLILGSSIHRIEERFAAAAVEGVEWREYMTALRRTTAGHEKWLAKCNLHVDKSLYASMLGGAQQAGDPLQLSTSADTPTAARTSTRTRQRSSAHHSPVDIDASKDDAPHPMASAKGHAGLALCKAVAVARKRHHQGRTVDADITFSAYPDAVRVRTVFSNEERRIGVEARKLINSLLPYKWLRQES
jgi:hypothetical protein